MIIRCECGRQLVEGTTRLDSSADAGPSAMRTTFTCPTCGNTYTRWTQRSLAQAGEPLVRWSPREPRG